jgi:endonuclease YncB( thermonuclease family)
MAGLAGTVRAAMSLRPLVLALLLALACVASGSAAKPSTGWTLGRISRVVDGDTIDLTNGQKIRLVQIDTPEVYFTPECYGEQASAITKRLLAAGTLVKLYLEPATDSIDRYGRLLRYVVRARDGLNVNVQLVRIGAAAPYFYDARRGRFANLLERLAVEAKSLRLGLWGLCRRTPYDPDRGVATGSISRG